MNMDEYRKKCVSADEAVKVIRSGDWIEYAWAASSPILLGEALANFVAFSSPEAIVLFGGLAKSGDYIMKPVQNALDKHVLNIFKGKTKLLVSELKDSDAAVLGASALGWELNRS